MIHSRQFEVEELSINELEVSKTNPRFIQTVLNEEFAIAELINLETKKMIKLTRSVLEKGMLPLTFYCFRENGKIVLADGNRRLTVLKILQRPELIPNNAKTRELIKICEEAKGFSFSEKFPCIIYEKWSDELFDILNSLHVTDESKSDWTPLAQYRMSSRHGGNKHAWMKSLLCYFDNDKVDVMTNRKADVYRRMFDAIKSIKIDIADSGELLTKNAKEKLEKVNRLIRNDVVNTRTDIETFKQKAREIFLEEELPAPPKYNMMFRSPILYETQNFDLEKLGLKIFDDGGNAVKFDLTEIKYSFKNPNGEEVADFSSIKGEWVSHLIYDGVSKDLSFEVVAKKEIAITLTLTKATLKLGNSINLRNYIGLATNSFNEDIRSKVKIKPIKSPLAKVEKDIFSGDNAEGIYIIQYQYKDKEGECSKTLFVEVSAEEDWSPLKGVLTPKPLLSWGKGSIVIKYDNTVAALVNEINKLSFSEYPNVIACSCRAILELSYDSLLVNGKIKPHQGKVEFIDRLKSIIEVLFENLQDIVHGDPQTFNSYHDEKNFLSTFDDSKLKAINGRLNSSAHKSGKNVNLTELSECIRTDISRLISLINQLLM